eukprot:659561-Amphidinium_carterae.1
MAALEAVDIEAAETQPASPAAFQTGLWTKCQNTKTSLYPVSEMDVSQQQQSTANGVDGNL